MGGCFYKRDFVYRYLLILFITLLVFSGSSCRTTRISSSDLERQAQMAPVTHRLPVDTDYPYHIVAKGETLWRICKNYDVDIKEVMRLNHLCDASKIEVGQKLRLPKYITAQKQERMQMGWGKYKGRIEASFIKPVRGRLVLSYGNCRDGWVNKGIEIKAGSLDVVAPKSGKVVFLGEDMDRYGQVIMIDHGDGYKSVISGNGKILVSVGETVRQGQVVMKLNNVGEILHFEVRRGAKPIDPLRVVHYER